MTIVSLETSERMGALVLKRAVQPLLWPDSIFQRTQIGKEHNDTLRILHGFTNASVTLTLRRPYGGRRTPKSSDSCGCRRNSAVAAGPPYGESLCFTGRKGGRRIIARSYNFFHFYVRRRNLSHRSHAVDASTATVRRTYGGRTEALRQSVASV